MEVLANLIVESFRNIYTYQVTTVNLHNVICQLFLNEARKKGGRQEGQNQRRLEGPRERDTVASGTWKRQILPGASRRNRP